MELSWFTLSLLLGALSQIHGSPRRSSKFTTFQNDHGIWGKQRSGSISNVATAGGSHNIVAPGQPSNIPKIQCSQAGFFPTPGSCFKFHRCVDFSGRGLWFSVFHFDCPAGTIFDPAISVCNHAWAVTTRPECNGVVAPVVTPSKPISVGSTFPPTHQTEKPVQQTISFTSPTVDHTSHTSRPVVAVKPTQAISFPDEDKNIPIICFRDKVYRVHPEYCNMYYYCEDADIKQFTCPAGLIFDSTSKSCSKDVECNSKVAPLSLKPIQVIDSSTTEAQTDLIGTTGIIRPLTVAPTTTESLPETTTTDFSIEYTTTMLPAGPEESSTHKVWEISPDSLYDCGAPGYYPFEGDCIRFYKCVETEEGKLTGLLYRCPPKFAYSDRVKRCEREELLPECRRVPQDAHTRLNIDEATQLYPHDLMWFFKN